MNRADYVKTDENGVHYVRVDDLLRSERVKKQLRKMRLIKISAPKFT